MTSTTKPGHAIRPFAEVKTEIRRSWILLHAKQPAMTGHRPAAHVCVYQDLGVVKVALWKDDSEYAIAGEAPNPTRDTWGVDAAGALAFVGDLIRTDGFLLIPRELDSDLGEETLRERLQRPALRSDAPTGQ